MEYWLWYYGVGFVTLGLLRWFFNETDITVSDITSWLVITFIWPAVVIAWLIELDDIVIIKRKKNIEN